MRVLGRDKKFYKLDKNDIGFDAKSLISQYQKRGDQKKKITPKGI